MTILDEVLEWSVGLKEMWMRDVLRRLVVQELLIQSDVDEVFRLFEHESGLRGGASPTAPIPLDANHLPNRSSAGAVCLVKIGPVAGVNAIVEDGAIDLEPRGMNVIYGRNASGKSGYSRVLKRACRARDQKEEVLGNVFAVGSAVEPRAEFRLLIDDKPTTVVWSPGMSPEETASIAVFDSRCARLYLDKAGEVVCRPYGFDVFKRLCDVMDGFTARLNEEKRQIAAALVDLPLMAQGTAAQAFLEKLSGKTTDDQVATACTFTDRSKCRLEELQRLLARDPEVEARRLQRLAQRLGALARALGALSELLDGERPKLTLAEAAVATAQDAVRRASELKFEDCLPGVGSEAWRVLFAAAEKYSISEAYQGETFPFVGSEARCVLCHQPLGHESRRRFVKFRDFVSDEAGKALAEAEKGLSEHRQVLASSIGSIREVDTALLDEMGELDGTLREQIEQLKETCRLLGGTAQALDDSVRNDVTEQVRSLPDLKATAQDLEAQAAEVLKGLDADERARRLAEVANLEATRVLSASPAAIFKRRDQMARLDLIERAKKPLRTKAVTDASMSILDAVVSADLINAWGTACCDLDVADRQVAINAEGGKGDCKTSLRLVGCAGSPGLDDVLSEGEQRALALAAFMAELSLVEEKNAVVFDDPVCSLDHNHRERVAKRFAALAADRQVVVFTHDLVFVKDIERHCARNGIGFGLSGVRRGGANKTGVPDEHPVELRPLRQHMQGLRDGLAVLKMEFAEHGESVEYRIGAQSWYVQLRDAWEKAVEEGLLNKVVQSYADKVMTNRLAEVAVEDTDWKEVEEGITGSSEALHRMSEARDSPFPTPVDMQQAAAAIDSFQKRVKARRKVLAEQRGKAEA